MRTREATWRDLSAMARLEAACFPHDAWSEATFWSELAERPHRSYWVATDGGGPEEPLVGYAGVSTVDDVAEVMTLAVDPGRRGCGLGARLLDLLHARAHDAGSTAVLLEVRADNEAARALYGTRGYRVAHTRRGYYRSAGGGPAVDALVMRKELV
ncbi:ribosomal protein S18-alanine N-acetyltransferase [Ornithinimicrobium pekingense]|uniref:[Ribosomal protein bS18]-alanine N-acetyltransferase n=1 Tax=Ornithinimicrobium pekingense TaxID=384677 RepID=A0ABQ2F9D2_9MICO|nr:ribosomal protein S18-alanine N-acetyltransferase [Ornithinimicrobium pekingense]GGK65316.1 N-acetyltransferase [Ornithinimicrobium pekingense]